MIWFHQLGRRGGLMVSALKSGASGPGSSLGGDILLCSWARPTSFPGGRVGEDPGNEVEARHFTLTVLLSTKVYK